MNKTVGLFAGVGGFERGLEAAGFRPTLLCEIDQNARSVLAGRFPDVKVSADVQKLRAIPKVDVLTAGFPCQDLSQAGTTKGIHGDSSGLVTELFRLLWRLESRPRWIVLENVPFMLQLQRGRAMRIITRALEDRGYAWAYRVIDARAFGLPQRRRRVLVVASRDEDPRAVLFGKNYSEPCTPRTPTSYGFYWTEGNTGIGWAIDCVPALKAGSTVSIPSPPAIWLVGKRKMVIPDVRDAERLQGFPNFWTTAAVAESGHHRRRWRLIGNAFPPPIAEWVGQRIKTYTRGKMHEGEKVALTSVWGSAGWGYRGTRFECTSSEWPVSREMPRLSDFLAFPTHPLSARATKGFLERLLASTLRANSRFISDLKFHTKVMESASG